MTPLPPHVFRAYDIRGVVGRELSEPFAYLLGRALGEEVRRRGGSRATLAYDARHSSEALMRAVAAGLDAVNVRAVSQGMGPTPLLYFAQRDGDYDLGVVVTGSHNPAAYNGFKIVYRAGAAHGEEISSLRTAMMSQPLPDEAADAAWRRFQPKQECRRDAYVAAALRSLRPAERKLRLSVDAGSGAAGSLARRVLEAMGHEVIGHALTPDGDFPVHHPDPTAEASLAYMREAVLRDGSDACLGLDGDGDRLAVVDARGAPLLGDRLLALFAEDVLREHPGATILGEVKCSRVFFEHVRACGGQARMGRVGHSVMKAQMRETGAKLAGEVSGHFFFADRWFGFDDGIYAAARFAEWLSADAAPLHERAAMLPSTFSTPELRVACRDDEKFARVARARDILGREARLELVDGVRAEWPDGWGLVRASNTEPALVLRAEATSAARRDEILRVLMQIVAATVDDT